MRINTGLMMYEVFVNSEETELWLLIIEFQLTCYISVIIANLTLLITLKLDETCINVGVHSNPLVT